MLRENPASVRLHPCPAFGGCSWRASWWPARARARPSRTPRSSPRSAPGRRTPARSSAAARPCAGARTASARHARPPAGSPGLRRARATPADSPGARTDRLLGSGGCRPDARSRRPVRRGRRGRHALVRADGGRGAALLGCAAARARDGVRSARYLRVAVGRDARVRAVARAADRLLGRRGRRPGAVRPRAGSPRSRPAGITRARSAPAASLRCWGARLSPARRGRGRAAIAAIAVGRDRACAVSLAGTRPLLGLRWGAARAGRDGPRLSARAARTAARSPDAGVDHLLGRRTARGRRSRPAGATRGSAQAPTTPARCGRPARSVCWGENAAGQASAPGGTLHAGQRRRGAQLRADASQGRSTAGAQPLAPGRSAGRHRSRRSAPAAITRCALQAGGSGGVLGRGPRRPVGAPRRELHAGERRRPAQLRGHARRPGALLGLRRLLPARPAARRLHPGRGGRRAHLRAHASRGGGLLGRERLRPGVGARGDVHAQVAAGKIHSCALTPAGAARCWGYDDFGQARPPAGTFTQISLGAYESCALTSAGDVRCWGDVPLFLPAAD